MSLLVVLFWFFVVLLAITVFGSLLILTVSFLFVIPYHMYLGNYIRKNNLTLDFQNTDDYWKVVRNAARLYNDLLHRRKPTFD